MSPHSSAGSLSYGVKQIKQLVCRISDSSRTSLLYGYVAGLDTGRAKLWFDSRPDSIPKVDARIRLEIILPENPDLEKQRCLSAAAKVKAVKAGADGTTVMECSFRKASFQELKPTGYCLTLHKLRRQK